MFSLNLLNFVTNNICHYSDKGGPNLPPLVLETKTLPQCQQDSCEKHNLKIEPNLCFSRSNLPDFLNSLNSMKVLLHLQKLF